MNKRNEMRRYDLTVEGLAAPQLSLAGRPVGQTILSAPADKLATYRVLVTVPGVEGTGTRPIIFILTDRISRESARYTSSFRGPAP